MKKIIIYGIFLIFPIFVYADFDMEACQNEYFNNCPSYSIGKVLENTKRKEFVNYNKLANGKIEKGLNYEKILFSMGNNYVFSFSGGIERYNEIVLNSRNLHNKNLSYYPKKDDIVLYSSPTYLGKKKIKENFYLDLDSNYSYSDYDYSDGEGGSVLGKEEYNYIINGYKEDFIFSDEFGGFKKIYCENDIIKIYNIANKPESLAVTFDAITKPKVDLGYNLKDLEKDLQVLAPCSNFNKLFGLEDNKKEEIIKEIILEEEEKSFFEKIIDFIKGFFDKLF